MISDSITVPATALLALLAGKMSLLDFCRQFEWADDETEMANPFRDRMRDGFEIADVLISQDADGVAWAEVRFRPIGTH